MKYNPSEIESKWQEVWQSEKIYQAKEASDKEKYYSLVMFPYPSGDLHIGHWYSYTGPDIYARYQRMNNKNVMHPFGFDAFGLPAENAAIKRGFHPDDWTDKNVASMTKQLKSTGISFDWSRLVNTSKPDYYRWTQWIFLQLYKKGLAYRGTAKVNWCETDQTVLANEQVEAGLCWRCGNPVVQKDLEQWFFKITEYADELIEALEGLDWPEKTKTMQKNWIGRSEGVTVSFKMAESSECIEVFTTRPDTLFGVTFVAISPNHPLLETIITPENAKAVVEYRELADRKTEREIQEKDEKTGVFTGGYAIHPLTNKKVPIWVADYVLAGYGTGAVMGVPAHDQRDWEFAKKYQLPIVKVIDGGSQEEAHSEPGDLFNSGEFNGLSSDVAKQKIISALKAKNLGETKTTYRLRDWLVSRQRYWGAPIPMVDCSKCGLVPVPETDLPVVLPREVDFTPTGVPPLATNDAFISVDCPQCHQGAKRVAETMDTFVDSSWYFLRYADPQNQNKIFDQGKVQEWLPVDIYVGGAEHTVLHLLYSRFFVKALRDMGYLQFDEPFLSLRHQGMILGPDHQKMSKSKGNVVNPDELVEDFGVDSVRVQLMFMGPYDQGGPWQLTGIHGAHRFLQRVWSYQQNTQNVWSDESSEGIVSQLAELTDKVGTDIQDFKFNTAVASLMGALNAITKGEKTSKKDWEKYLTLLAPFAPHITEELWQQLGHKQSIHAQSWPKVDRDALKNHMQAAKLAVQVNGKVRGVIEVEPNITQEAALELANASQSVARHISGKNIKKIVYVPGKVLNLVVA